MNTKKILRTLLGFFLQGLIYIAPLFITGYAIYFSFLYVDELLNQYIRTYLKFNIPGLGLITIVLLITLVGFLGRTIIFRPMMGYLDKAAAKVPFIKIIYSSIKDLLTAFVGQKRKFTEPVLVKVNRESDLEKLGFVTQRDLSSLGIDSKRVAVYLPHSYNFSGNLFIVSADNVRPINAPAAEVMKFIVSAGVTGIENQENEPIA
ncbi:MAG: DUF502 domain-containing protein [Bacteroidales bacterium]|nr:DUF502 domain-containing protein [Bacteroidales bacterium]